MLVRKFRKLHRYLSARLRPHSATPFFWHIGRPNFGDDINPSMFSILSGQQIRFEAKRYRRHYLGMGSILSHAVPTSTIMGSGFLASSEADGLSPGKIVSLRGELSRNALKLDQDIPLGDPMVLLNEMTDIQCDRNGPIGYIPHVSQVKKLGRIDQNKVKIIHPGISPWKVINEIATCSAIISQSLHGLIVADALEIPNIWVEPTTAMKGGRFKFDDYFSTLDASKTAFAYSEQLLKTPPLKEFHIGHYKYNKKEYLSLLRAELSSDQ